VQGTTNIAFWHLSDMLNALTNVCFGGHQFAQNAKAMRSLVGRWVVVLLFQIIQQNEQDRV
jgi:hypothetical protein